MGLIFKSKKEKQELKELKEYFDTLDKIEDEITEEEDKKRKEEEKGNPVIQMLNIIDNDPEDEELKKYMTTEQLIEEEKDKRVGKVYAISAVVIMAISVIVLVSISYIFFFNNQDDLNRVFKYDILNYYSSRYNSSTKLNKLEYVCYEEVKEDNQKEKICTDLIYALTDNNKVIMKRNDLYGDNISLTTFYDDYKTLLTDYNPDMKLLWNNPIISDKDFYINYNKFYDYINVMPANSTFNNLLKNNKLNIVDVIMYQGDINVDRMKGLLGQLDYGSEFVFIKSSEGSPVNLKVIAKDKYVDLNVIGETYPDENIVNYQFDTATNNIAGITVTKTSPDAIRPKGKDYTFESAYHINTTSVRRNYKDKGQYPSYYLVMFNNYLLEGNIKQYNSTSETDVDKYINYHYLSFGGKTYIVAEKSIGLAKVKSK